MASSQCVFPRLWGLVAVIFVAISLVIAQPSSAQGVPQLTVGQLTGEDRPVLDGIVNEGIWSGESVYSTFTQQEPSEGQLATERTDVWFAMDETNLYVAVICYDSEPGSLVVSQSRRDADLRDTDSVQILLDTFNDGQNAFVFGTNPFGIEYDAQVMAEGQTGGGGFGGGGFNLNWDADWTVRTSPSERGWEAEFAIPLRTLRYDPGEERVWGVNVQRNIRRKNELVFLAPVPTWLLAPARVGCGQAERAQPAGPPRSEVHTVRGRVVQRRQDAGDRHGGSQRRHRPRRQVGSSGRPDPRSVSQYRLRSGGG